VKIKGGRKSFVFLLLLLSFSSSLLSLRTSLRLSLPNDCTIETKSALKERERERILLVEKTEQKQTQRKILRDSQPEKGNFDNFLLALSSEFHI
jgi:hypothetical protein